MVNVDASIPIPAAQDDRGLLIFACVHKLSPADLHKLVETLRRGAGQVSFR